MNRFIPYRSSIPTAFIDSIDEAHSELYQCGWSTGHVVFDGVHQVSGHKQEAWIVANAPTELDAWLLACVKANEQELLWRHRN